MDNGCSAIAVALVGISGYGRVYLRQVEAAVARGKVRFVAAVVLCEDQEREVCQRLRAIGVRIYGDWREMLAEWRGRLDLCMLPVPIHFHCEITIAALFAGANVLVEKPLAATFEQVEAVRQAEKRTGRWVAVGYQDFYAATTQRIWDRVAGGYLGKILAVRFLGLWPRPSTYFSRNDWAGRIFVGPRVVRDSPLNNAMAHFVNLSLFWACDDLNTTVLPFQLEAELFRCYPIESFDTAVVRMKTGSGVWIYMAATHCCPETRPIRIEVLGEKGDLTWTHRQEAIWRRNGKGERWGVETESEVVDSMFAAVLRRLTDPSTRICTSTQAASQVACIEEIHARSPILDSSLSRPGAVFGENLIVSPGIENELRQCVRTGAMPSELGFGWAGTTKSFKMTERRAPRCLNQASTI